MAHTVKRNIILLSLFFIAAKADCLTDPAVRPDEWDCVKSRYFTIYYKKDADLKSVEKRLRRRTFYMAGMQKPDPLASVDEKIACRLDVLFQRAKQILDMYPSNMNVRIIVFSTQSELIDEYSAIFRYRDEDIRSFYIFKYDTVYTSEEDICDSIMAHEFAHAISDHYFMVPAPEKVKEMLASHVDESLDE